MIPKYYFEKTYKIDDKSIIENLKYVYDDANTGGLIGYLSDFANNEDEIVGRVQSMKGQNYYIADDLLNKIHDSLDNNFNESELEEIANFI